MNKLDKEIKNLITACIQKDNRAQKMFFDKFAPTLYPICMRYMKSVEDANDVLQIGFIKIFNYLELYKPTGNFEGWLKRIIINTAIEQLRKRKLLIDLEDMTGLDTPRVQNTAIASMSAKQIIDLINQLPDGYRTIFNMYCIDGFSHKEIANQLNITESTSKSQLFKARKILQKWVSNLF